jgi:hypothetical protein
VGLDKRHYRDEKYILTQLNSRYYQPYFINLPVLLLDVSHLVKHQNTETVEGQLNNIGRILVGLQFRNILRGDGFTLAFLSLFATFRGVSGVLRGGGFSWTFCGLGS